MSPEERTDQLRAAEQRWAKALGEWAIPQRILDAAPEDPWGFPVARFAGRADRAVRQRSGASFAEQARLIAAGSTLLDVGAGAGAASLPHAAECAEITAVDSEEEMLDAFAQRADALHVQHREVLGSWPQVATVVSSHDVVLAHHVVYNVPQIGPFLAALTERARVGVVLELPPRHPLAWMNPLWEHFHQLTRPATPTSDDLLTILTLQGVRELRAQPWTRLDPAAADGSDEESPDARAALVTRRLCLPPERAPDVAAALRTLPGLPQGDQRDVVTVSWQGQAAKERQKWATGG